MLPGDDCKNDKRGPHAEVLVCKSVLCDVARSSRLPELPDSDCQDRFCGVGRTYVLNLNIRETYSSVKSPGGGLVTVARFPPIPYCRVAEKMFNTIVIRRSCTRMDIPWARPRIRGGSVFPGPR